MYSNRFWLAIACAVAIISSSIPSFAESEGKGFNLFLSNSLSARALPRLAIRNRIDLNARYYYMNSDSLLWKNNYIGGGIGDSLSPATNTIAAFIEVEPIAIFNLRLEYGFLQYFGFFTCMLQFPDKNSDYSNEELSRKSDDNEAVPALGHNFTIKPTLKLMFWRIIALNVATVEWFIMHKDDYFYLPAHDTLAKTTDNVFTNAAFLGFIIWEKSEDQRVVLGARHLYMRVTSTGIDRHALQGVAAWMIYPKLWIFEKPKLVVVGGGYLSDRYREHDGYLGGAFVAEFTLIPR
ncbi:MAG: hypothetical protein GY847_38540 [Proteobacteria bacterium]|nr:hypothetical protein [Pseudomonadota bacterium]